MSLYSGGLSSGPAPDRHIRFVVSDEVMDEEQVDWPAYISARDGGTGYGDRCWIVECTGTAVQDGVDAVLAVYPTARVTASRSQAMDWLYGRS